MSVKAAFSFTRTGQGLASVLSTLAGGSNYAKAGILGQKASKNHETEEGEKQSLTNVQLGLIHEFGAPSAGIPARPFVLASFAKHRAEYVRDLGKGLAQVMAGKIDKDRLLGLIGLKMAADMKKFVRDREVSPQLDPSGATYARKMSKSKPNATRDPAALIDTGQLVNAISSAVVGDKTGGDA